jgi:hypothetical protein
MNCIKHSDKPTQILLTSQQFNGSGSGSVGSVCFCASRSPIRIRHYLYGSGSESGSFHQQAKKVRKNLTYTTLWLFFDYLSLKTDVNVPSKSKMQKHFEKNKFLLAFCQPLMEKAESGSVNQWYWSADPGPYQNDTSTTLLPSIPPMSRIWKTQAEIITCCLSLSFSFSSFYLSVSALYLSINSPPPLPPFLKSVCLSPSVIYLSTFTNLPSLSLTVYVSRLSLSVTRHFCLSLEYLSSISPHLSLVSFYALVQ